MDDVVVAEDEDVPGGGWRDEELPGVVLMVDPEESSDEAETFETTEETIDRSTNSLVACLIIPKGEKEGLTLVRQTIQCRRRLFDGVKITKMQISPIMRQLHVFVPL